MSGKPAARLSDATQCPKKGHGSNAIASGSPDVLFNGIPAARQGDTTACGSAISGQVIPSVLINGRPAVVTGSTGSHGDVVVGGSGNIFIGGAVSFGSGAPSAATALTPQALAPTSQHLRQQSPSSPPPETLEYEEEEEETELPLEQRITLRLGMFFDGTGNNLANAALTEQCRRQDLQDFDPETLQAVTRLCESRQYRDTNGDGLFDQVPGSSYGNAMTNVALLSRLYEDSTDEILEPTATSASLPVYIDGIGTSSGGSDSLRGMATGRGDTGVIARVAQSPNLIEDQLRLLLASNPHLLIERVEFDIFGFSRGAAAARHFANELLKPHGGLLRALNQNSPVFVDGFNWPEHACINFIGLFDTVAAIIDPARSDLSAGNARNPGVNLYLPPNCARKVVQLTAQHEERHLFSLNQVDPAHEEIVLPGVHSDIGGGYPPLMHERLLVDRPRVIPYQRGSDNSSSNAIRATRQWDKRNTVQMQLMGLGLPGDGEFKREQISRAARNQRNLDATDTVLTLGLDRKVRGELSRVALRVMHILGIQHGVVFQPLDESDNRISIPPELQPIAEKVITYAKRGLSAPLTAEESRLLHGYYIHRSAHWTTSRGLLINRPRSGGRAVYPDQPQIGYPQ